MKSLSAVVLFLLLVVPSAGAQPASAPLPVAVESGLFGDSAYLLFRWDSPPAFESKITATAGQNLGPTLDVTFERAAVFDFERAERRLSEYVQRIAARDARRVSITLKPSVQVETRSDDNGIVLYFRRGAQAKPGLSLSAQARRVDSFLPTPPLPGQATPFEVVLNAEQHDTYDRLSFEWQIDVDYQARLLPRQDKPFELIITFNKRAQFDNLQATLSSLPNVFGEARQNANGKQLRIDVLSPVRLRDFPYGNRVVIDLLRKEESKTALTRAPPRRPLLPSVSVRGGRLEDYTRFIFDYAVPTQYLVRRRGARLEVEFNRANPLDFRELGLSRSSLFTPARSQRFADSVVFSIPVPPENAFRHFVSGTRVVLDVMHRVIIPSTRLSAIKGRSPSALPDFFLPEPRRFGLAHDVAINATASEIAASRPAPFYQFRIPLTESAAVAFFKRGRNLWFVADRVAETTFFEHEDQNAIGEIESLPSFNFTILRFSPSRELFPAIRREGLGWWLEFHEQPVAPYVPLDTVITQGSEPQEQTRFTFLLPRYGATLRLEDSDIGDEIYVVPVASPSSGIGRAHRYPEFQVLSSAQGVALVPLSSDLQVTEGEGRLVVSHPGGLNLSTLDVDRAISESAADALIQLPILDFPRWEHPGSSLEETRDRFNRRFLQGLGEQDREIFLDLAGYYLSQGLGQETLGVLDLYARSLPTNGLRYRLMRAIALLLSGRTNEAVGVLRAPLFDRVQEAYLWRAVAAAADRRWALAERYFQQSGNFYQLYSPAIIAYVSLARIATALSRDNSSAAALWLKRAESLPESEIRRSDRDALRYFDGALEVLRGNPQQARAQWQSLAAGPRRGYWQVRAELDSLVLARDHKMLELQSVLEQLERLYLAWRGDFLSYRILEELGKSYGLAGLYYQQLTLYREAISRHPSIPETIPLSKTMIDLFGDLFLKSARLSLQPWQAYSIYTDFKELIPPGGDRTALIEAAANSISSGGFYESAAEVLEQDLLSESNLQNREYFVVKTSLLLLLARLPQRALSLLDRNTFSESSFYKSDARRLRARALVPLDDPARAEELLAGDVSEEADLLRFSIYRNTQNWAAAAAALQRLVGPPPQHEDATLSKQKTLRLLYLISALYLAEEAQALESVRKDYKNALDDTPLKPLFDFITSNGEESQSVKTLLERLDKSAASETNFLTLYKRRFLPQEADDS